MLNQPIWQDTLIYLYSPMPKAHICIAPWGTEFVLLSGLYELFSDWCPTIWWRSNPQMVHLRDFLLSTQDVYPNNWTMVNPSPWETNDFGVLKSLLAFSFKENMHLWLFHTFQTTLPFRCAHPASAKKRSCLSQVFDRLWWLESSSYKGTGSAVQDNGLVVSTCIIRNEIQFIWHEIMLLQQQTNVLETSKIESSR